MQTLASGEVEEKREENKVSRFPKCTFNPLLVCLNVLWNVNLCYLKFFHLSICLAFYDTSWIQIKSKLCDSSISYICI